MNLSDIDTTSLGAMLELGERIDVELYKAIAYELERRERDDVSRPDLSEDT